MKTILTLRIVGPLLFPLAVLAQTDALGPNDLRDRAFRMAKATVEFLATDAKTYGYPDKTACPDCVSYPSLKAFVKEQKLTKADELVNETERWAAAPATLAKAPVAALAELRSQLMNRVTAGSERQHRRSLPSFATYESQMNQLAGGAAPASIAMNADEQQTNESTADLQDAQPDSVYDGETVAPLSQTQSADSGWVSKSGLALLLSLLSLALLSWLLIFRKKGDSSSKPADAASDMKVAQLNDELMHVKGDVRRTIEINGKLQQRVEQLENQVSVLQKAVGVASAVLTTAVTPPASGASAGVNPAKEGQRPPAPNPATRQQTQSGGGNGPTPVNPNPALANRAEQAASQPAAQPQPTTPAPPENRPRTASPAVEPSNRPNPQPSADPSDRPTRSVESPQPPAPRVLYARTVDLGDGFSVDSLSETTTERPMVYQIQVQTPGQATFRVADDPYAQRLALSDPYSYLNDACEYTSQPASNSRIQTTKPGRLVLQGSKWVIQEKAQIGFS